MEEVNCVEPMETTAQTALDSYRKQADESIIGTMSQMIDDS